jgi:hypothetical protein
VRRADCLIISFQLVLAVGLLPSIAAADPTVWSGLTKSFSKAGFADSTDPANWDQFTPNVAITRADLFGMFNPLGEMSYSSTSPAGTLWATDLNNEEGVTISAANYENLNFNPWIDAYGGQFQAGNNVVPFAEPPRDAVLYLIDDDVYLDIRFTEWGQGRGAGGSFAYLRAEPVPEPTAGLLAVVALAGLGIGRPGRFPRKSTNP